MNVKVQIDGLDKLSDLLVKAKRQSDDLQATAAEINRAVYALEVELNQPTAGTIG